MDTCEGDAAMAESRKTVEDCGRSMHGRVRPQVFYKIETREEHAIHESIERIDRILPTWEISPRSRERGHHFFHFITPGRTSSALSRV